MRAKSSTRTCQLFTLLIVLSIQVGACGGGPDPNAANANAGCEEAPADLLMSKETMLPGRVCLNCHREGGQATQPSLRWTIAGTVFSSASAGCNDGGVAGATVEILTQSGSVQLTLKTNAAGNFYSLTPVTFPLRARVSMAGKATQEMSTPQLSGSCASCHAKPGLSGAPGRLFIN